MATLTTDASVFEVFGPLSVRDNSLDVEASVRIKVLILPRLGAYHKKLYVSLCWTSEGDPLSHPFRGFPLTVTANIIVT